MTKARVNADNASADIQGVTAGTGLQGGGTSGTVTLTNGMATTIDAKGDLIVGTGADTFDRLAAGSTGDTIVADSSTSTGLRYQGNFAAGKNKIINGDFGINQRAFTSTTTNGGYGFDRWLMFFTGGTVTYSAQTFTPGTAPVSGYEGINFARLQTQSQSASSNFAQLVTRLEDVRNFAGQTATVSFWAKAASGTPKIGLTTVQQFGSGGSPSSGVVTSNGDVTVSTSWTRYSLTISVPSISGKTIGTTANTSYLEVVFNVSLGADYPSYGSIGVQNNTFDIWGVQIEAGSTATPFTTATGTIQGELAACQRYYQQVINGINQNIGVGWNYSTSYAMAILYLPVVMRTAPTIAVTSGTDYYFFERGNGTDLVNAFFGAANTNPNNTITLRNSTEVSGTAGQAGLFFGNNASSNISLSAEL